MLEIKKKVSVALATYNGSKFIIEQLNSILNQTLPINEIVIIDDCSTDDTYELLKAYNFYGVDVILEKNEKNMGVVATFKKAVLRTSGDFVALCDQDDIWFPKKIEILIESSSALNNLDNPIMIASDLSLVNQSGVEVRSTFWGLHRLQPNRTSFEKALVYNEIVGCSMFINKALVKYIKLMPTNIMMHDHWIFLISKSFGRCIIINKPLLWYREHFQSVTEKRKIGFVKRFIGFFSSLLSKDYLEKNISQAKLFLDCYKDELSEKNKKSIQSLASLSNKVFLKKWFWVKRR